MKSTIERNALYSVSRNAWKEIQADWKAKGIDDSSNVKLVGQREKAARAILLEWEKKVNPRFTLCQIIYGIGVIRGILGEK